MKILSDNKIIIREMMLKKYYCDLQIPAETLDSLIKNGLDVNKWEEKNFPSKIISI